MASKFYSIKGRRGAKKAAVATGRLIIVAAFHVIKKVEPYRELGGDYLLKLRSNNVVKSMTARLKTLGYEVIRKAI